MTSRRGLLALTKYAAKLAGLALAAYAGLIFVLSLVHQRPPAQVSLRIVGSGRPGNSPERLNLLTWNIGYAGTGEEADLFMDGGHDVLAKDPATVLKHLANISDALRQYPRDIYFLQEADLDARRTYGVNEIVFLTSRFKEFAYSSALNFDVWFVPYPFTRPMGRVRSGLLSLGSYRPAAATRVQLPGSFAWPISAFALDRCLLVWRLPREDGKDWVLINLHLAAWDANGELRKQELAFLQEFAVTQYSQGSYVVIGGDWNAVLPGVRPNQFPSRDKPSRYLMTMPPNAFPSEWKWGVATSHPSDRQVDAPYKPGKTYVTTVDGFVVSPNVRIESVDAVALNFKDSDHEPVTISVAGP